MGGPENPLIAKTKQTRDQILEQVRVCWREASTDERSCVIWLQCHIIDPFVYADYSPPTIEELE